MSNSEVPLLQQLSLNSDPYRDPLAVLDWRSLALDRYWLPPEAISLYGLAEFDSLSEPARIRLSQYEMLGYAQAGVLLERIFLESTVRRLRRTRETAEYAYLMHELREQAGHSLMFLKLAAASGLTLPARACALPRITQPASRALSASALYWAVLVIGEDIPDKMHRFIRRQAGNTLTPLIRQMITLHMVDEARHIAYARQRLDSAMSARGPMGARVYSAIVDRLFNRFVRGYFWPRAELYECAGLGAGIPWRRLALRNPHRREFVLKLVAPTMRLLAGHGLTLKLR